MIQVNNRDPTQFSIWLSRAKIRAINQLTPIKQHNESNKKVEPVHFAIGHP